MPLHLFSYHPLRLHPPPRHLLSLRPTCSLFSSNPNPRLKKTNPNPNAKPYFPYFISKPSPTPTPAPLHLGAAAGSIPARDRVIDFGRYKGRRLGSLPSSYLKWMIFGIVKTSYRKGARGARIILPDVDKWAYPAKTVLADDVYRDRIEWEFADRILFGDDVKNDQGDIDDVFEVAERFGWDIKDEEGWRRINFDLLGTSYSGRIPRIRKDGEKLESSKEGGFSRGRRFNAGNDEDEDEDEFEDEEDEELGMMEVGDGKVTFEKLTPIVIDENGVAHEDLVDGKRRERRGRRKMKVEEERRMKRMQQISMVKKKVGAETESKKGGSQNGRPFTIFNPSIENGQSPFPGRASLFDQMKERRG